MTAPKRFKAGTTWRVQDRSGWILATGTNPDKLRSSAAKFMNDSWPHLASLGWRVIKDVSAPRKKRIK